MGVRKKGKQYKEQEDRRNSVKAQIVERGQWVRVKLPETRIRKGEIRYSYPHKIEEVSEDGSAVRLMNGQWWNMGRVVKVDAPKGCSDENQGLPRGEEHDTKKGSTCGEPVQSLETLRRGNRFRRLPCKFKEYHM